MQELLPVIDLPSGVRVSAGIVVKTDWVGIRTLIESGVPVDTVAEHFKLDPKSILHKSKQEGWLSPTRVEKLRRKIGERQAAVFRSSGTVADINEVKATIWKERGERLRERTYQVAKTALEQSQTVLIETPKDLKDMLEVTRILSGEAKEENASPSLAISIGFLRSARPGDVVDV